MFSGQSVYVLGPLHLAIPLAKLPPEQLDWINTLVSNTLNKKEVIEQVEEYFGRRIERESPC